MSLKYSFLATISAFGGLGGIFVGASLVSMTEILFLFGDIVTTLFDVLNNKMRMLKGRKIEPE